MKRVKTVHLKHQAWVHRPRYDENIARAIDEGIDYCLPCAEIVAEEYRKKFPEFAKEICAEGGNCIRESDSPPQCYRCAIPLSCSIIGTGKVIWTEAQWLKHP